MKNLPTQPISESSFQTLIVKHATETSVRSPAKPEANSAATPFPVTLLFPVTPLWIRGKLVEMRIRTTIALYLI
jgi:hypothetical protein